MYYDFTVEMKKYIPAGSSKVPKVEPGTCIYISLLTLISLVPRPFE